MALERPIRAMMVVPGASIAQLSGTLDRGDQSRGESTMQAFTQQHTDAHLYMMRPLSWVVANKQSEWGGTSSRSTF